MCVLFSLCDIIVHHLGNALKFVGQFCFESVHEGAGSIRLRGSRCYGRVYVC